VAEEWAARCGSGGAAASPDGGGGNVELGVVGCRVVSDGNNSGRRRSSVDDDGPAAGSGAAKAVKTPRVADEAASEKESSEAVGAPPTADGRGGGDVRIRERIQPAENMWR
jgi:hypothetical protein